MEYTNDFVLKVNEVFHDVDSAEYEKKHPEIFDYEVERWRILISKFVDSNTVYPRILDIGSGTGFVPLQLIKYLTNGNIICSDVSSKILEKCRNNIEKVQDNGIKIDYLTIVDGNFQLEENTIDLITINSVLHHVPDRKHFFQNLKKLLNEKSVLIIAHEPNKKFFQNKLLWFNYKIISFFFNPGQFLIEFLMKYNLFESLRHKLARYSSSLKSYNRIMNSVNDSLLSQRITTKPLTAAEITSIVDINSPGAGGVFGNRGFSIEDIQAELQDFKLIDFETYDHISKTSAKNWLTRRYSLFLQKHYPGYGANLTAVFKKI